MNRFLPALILAAGLSSPAWADTTYTVHKVIITGSKTVPTSQLMAVVQERPGQKVTVADITADRDAISKVLENAHVAGSIEVSVRTEGATSDIIFAIQDQGVQQPTVTTVAPKLHAEIFEGNMALPTATLATASGLNPGDDLTNQKILAAEQAIKNAYVAAKAPVNVSISGENKNNGDGTYDVIWHITETKATGTKTQKSTQDQGSTSGE